MHFLFCLLFLCGFPSTFSLHPSSFTLFLLQLPPTFLNVLLPSRPPREFHILFFPFFFCCFERFVTLPSARGDIVFLPFPLKRKLEATFGCAPNRTAEFFFTNPDLLYFFDGPLTVKASMSSPDSSFTLRTPPGLFNGNESPPHLPYDLPARRTAESWRLSWGLFFFGGVASPFVPENFQPPSRTFRPPAAESPVFWTPRHRPLSLAPHQSFFFIQRGITFPLFGEACKA